MARSTGLSRSRTAVVAQERCRTVRIVIRLVPNVHILWLSGVALRVFKADLGKLLWYGTLVNGLGWNSGHVGRADIVYRIGALTSIE